MDYIIELNGEVIPIEVKAGKSSALKSMDIFLGEKLSSPYGIHFSQLNFSANGKIRKLPLYSVIKIFNVSQL